MQKKIRVFRGWTTKLSRVLLCLHPLWLSKWGKLIKQGRRKKNKNFITHLSLLQLSRFWGSKRENWCMYHFLPFLAKASFKKSHIKRNPAIPIPRIIECPECVVPFGEESWGSWRKGCWFRASVFFFFLQSIRKLWSAWRYWSKMIWRGFLLDIWLESWVGILIERCWGGGDVVCTHKCSDVLVPKWSWRWGVRGSNNKIFANEYYLESTKLQERQWRICHWYHPSKTWLAVMPPSGLRLVWMIGWVGWPWWLSSANKVRGMLIAEAKPVKSHRE